MLKYDHIGATYNFLNSTTLDPITINCQSTGIINLRDDRPLPRAPWLHLKRVMGCPNCLGINKITRDFEGTCEYCGGVLEVNDDS